MKYKLFRDPIYGYIKVEEDIVTNIIDTACFQRLRNIRQTSYAPLYPASYHNRFVHSLGVFHLGCLALKALKEQQCLLKLGENKDKYCDTFLLACLLHDVGHAPFSHSGELFFLSKMDNEVPIIYQALKNAVDDIEFSQSCDTYVNGGRAAAAHEVMSVIIAIKEYPHLIKDKSFFARCVLGYKYNPENLNKKLLNCIITLLNSSLIDVDRLDYVIRDAFTTGYQSVSIDYERLLSGLIITQDDGQVAYKKSAISVIENIVYAHDSEKKWIQSHPTILYETLIIEYIIREFCKETDNDLFDVDTLSCIGRHLKNHKFIRLLSDDDIIAYAKNEKYENDFVKELFSRNTRRHAIWKSEAEYRMLLEKIFSAEARTILAAHFKALEDFLVKSGIAVLNVEVIHLCEKNIRETEKSAITDVDKEARINLAQKIIKVASIFKEFAEKVGIEFDFVFINTKRFSSNFSKPDLGSVLIKLDQQQIELQKITNLLCAKGSDSDLYYIFYKRKPGCKLKNEYIMGMLYQIYSIDISV